MVPILSPVSRVPVILSLELYDQKDDPEINLRILIDED